MTPSALADETERYLRIYGPRLLGNDWRIRVVVVPGDEMSQKHGVPAMASSTWMSGEQSARFELNADTPWNDGVNDLERTVVHELVHGMFDLLGFERAFARVQERLAAFSPMSSADLGETASETLEEVIDRVATIIVGAYGHTHVPLVPPRKGRASRVSKRRGSGG